MTDYNEIETKNLDVMSEADANQEQEKPKMEQIVTKVPKKKKKGLMERLVVGMLGPDGLPAIGNSLKNEIVMPAIKNIIVDSITSGINQAMFGGEGRAPRQQGRGNNYYAGKPVEPPRTNYASSYQQKTNYHQPAPAQPRINGNRVDEYILEQRGEAVGVLDQLFEAIQTYGVVSVADYYDLIGVESKFTDNGWGWEGDDLRSATVLPASGGHVIKLPPVRKITG